MYNIIKNGSHAQYGTYDLIADFKSDIINAPKTVAPGSKMFCIESSTTYIFTPSEEWVIYTQNSGGGGGCDHEYYGDDFF